MKYKLIKHDWQEIVLGKPLCQQELENIYKNIDSWLKKLDTPRILSYSLCTFLIGAELLKCTFLIVNEYIL